MDVHTLRRIAGRAIASGGSLVSRFTVEWDISGRCRSSVVRVLMARSQIPRDNKDQRSWSSTDPGADIFRVILHTRCRKCDMCLKHRGFQWKAKAQRELLQAPRTWFVTLTLSPDNHFLMELKATERLLSQGTKFSDLTMLQQYQERDAEIYPHIQLFFKRLRKNTGTKFRYLVVSEMHSEKLLGYPHYHMLLHEISGLRPIFKRETQAEWKFGFSTVKLVEENAPHAHWYVTKYLTKEASTRVRASFRYGHGPTLSKHTKTQMEGVRGNRLVGAPASMDIETGDSVERTTYPPFPHFARRGLEDIRDTLGPKKEGN